MKLIVSKLVLDVLRSCFFTNYILQFENSSCHLQIMVVPPKVLAEIDHGEAQRLYATEEAHIGDQDLSIFFDVPNPNDLQGEPLSLKEVKKLCPNWFVRSTLYQVSGHAKETTPLKTGDLNYKGLAKVLFSRFIQKERALPNIHQIAIYFIQQTQVQDILQRRVDWNDHPRNAGIGKGRPADKAHA